MIGSK